MLVIRIILSLGLMFSSMALADGGASSLSFQFEDGSNVVVFGDVVDSEFVSIDDSESRVIFDQILNYVEEHGFDGVDTTFEEDGQTSKVVMGTNGDSSTIGFVATLPSGKEFSWSESGDQ